MYGLSNYTKAKATCTLPLFVQIWTMCMCNYENNSDNRQFYKQLKKYNKFSTVLLLHKCNLMKCEVARYSRSPMRHGYFSNPLEKGIRVH